MVDKDINSNRLNSVDIIQRPGNTKDAISDAKHAAFKDSASMKTNLIRLGMTAAQVDRLNKNDMIFALRERWAEPA